MEVRCEHFENPDKAGPHRPREKAQVKRPVPIGLSVCFELRYFAVLLAVFLKVQVFWDVAPSRLIVTGVSYMRTAIVFLEDLNPHVVNCYKMSRELALILRS
jgi:hypothetical protein